MTVVAVYVSPFVALSLGVTTRSLCLFRVRMYTKYSTAQQVLRASDLYPQFSALSFLVSHLSAEVMGMRVSFERHIHKNTSSQVRCTEKSHSHADMTMTYGC